MCYEHELGVSRRWTKVSSLPQPHRSTTSTSTSNRNLQPSTYQLQPQSSAHIEPLTYFSSFVLRSNRGNAKTFSRSHVCLTGHDPHVDIVDIVQHQIYTTTLRLAFSRASSYIENRRILMRCRSSTHNERTVRFSPLASSTLGLFSSLRSSNLILVDVHPLYMHSES